MKTSSNNWIPAFYNPLAGGRIMASFILINFLLQFGLVTMVYSLPKYYFSDSISDANQKNDSLEPKLSSTIHLNSLGYFGFGGRIVSDKQALGANLIYERQKWGAFLYKVVDLFDPRSPNNFAMAMVFTELNVNDRLTITPYTGFVIEQIHGIADKDSDLGVIINSRFKLSKQLALDHTIVLSNLVLAPSHMDWVNRFRLIFDSGHYNITWLGWHNNSVLDKSNYYSAGLSASYNKIELSDKIKMNTGITAFKMIHTSDSEVNPKMDGLLFNLALVIN